MTSRPCLTCGEPASGSYCPAHQPDHGGHQPDHGGHREPSARRRGYTSAWTKLSERARRMQPWCSDCGTTEYLTADHLPSAWARQELGKPLRLRDVDVVCGPCNLRRGSSRPGSQRAAQAATEAAQTHGEGPAAGVYGPGGKKPQPPSHTPGGYR